VDSNGSADKQQGVTSHPQRPHTHPRPPALPRKFAAAVGTNVSKQLHGSTLNLTACRSKRSIRNRAHLCTRMRCLVLNPGDIDVIDLLCAMAARASLWRHPVWSSC